MEIRAWEAQSPSVSGLDPRSGHQLSHRNRRGPKPWTDKLGAKETFSRFPGGRIEAREEGVSWEVAAMLRSQY